MKAVWDYEVFLSHNSRDKPAVENLARRLLEAGVKPWFDKWDLVPGEDWLPAIEAAMRASPTIAVCVGPSGFGKVHNTELQAALNATYADDQKRVLPVLLPGAVDGGAELPEFLKLKTWIDYRREDDEAFDRLAKAVRGERPGAGAPESSECPYRGLEPFRSEHARFFYGREREVAALLDSLRSGDRLMFLVGASGSGKSSLVLAGVVPAVRSGQLDDSYSWRVVSLKPGSRPCRSLARALLEIDRLDHADSAEPSNGLVERVSVAGGGQERPGMLGLRASSALLEIVQQFEAESRNVHDFDQGRALLARLERAVNRTLAELDSETGAEQDLARELTQIERLSQVLLHRVEAFADGVAASLPPDTNLLLVVDQFEELFTLAEDPVARGSFLEGILHAARAPGSRVHVIITARADFLGKFLADPLIAPIVQSSLSVALSVMDRDQIERSIRGPAGQVGLQVEEAVVDALVEGVAGEPGDLPLLQFTLYELWRNRQAGKITWDAYTAMGGIKGAIAQRAEGVFEELGEGETGARDQQTLRRILGRLVQLGEGTEDTRRRATREELQAVDPERAEALVERLVETRLVTVSENKVEVAHEAVIREWGRLRRWVDEDRSALRLRQEISHAEELWSAGVGEEGDLWRGGRLERALELQKSGELILAPKELAFLEASEEASRAELRAEEERREREIRSARELAETRGRASRRLRIGVVATSLLAVVAVGLGLMTLSFLQTATSREIALASETVEAADGMQSLLLAIEAVQKAETPEAIRELYDSLTESHERLVVRHEQAVLYAAWNASGDRILTFSIDRRARLWSYHDDSEHVTAHWLATSGPVSGARWDSNGEKIRLAPFGSAPLTFYDGNQEPVQGIEFLEEPETVSAETESQVDTPGALPAVPDDVRWPEGMRGKIATSILDAAGPEVTIQYIPGHLDSVRHVSFEPPAEPELVLTLSHDNTGRVWTLEGKQKAVLRGHSGSVLHGAWHPGGNHVITASKDGTARIWEIEVLLDVEPRTAEAAEAEDPGPPPLLQGRPSPPTFFRWSPDGRYLLQADDLGMVWLYLDPDGRQPGPQGIPHALLTGHQEEILDVDWHPHAEPEKILTTSFDHTGRVWSLPSATALSSAQGENLTDLGAGPAQILVGHLTAVRKGRFSPDGKLVLTVGAGGTACLWDEQWRIIAFLGAESDKVEDAYWGVDAEGHNVFHVIHRDGSSRTWPGTVDNLLQQALERRSWVVDEGTGEEGPRVRTAER